MREGIFSRIPRPYLNIIKFAGFLAAVALGVYLAAKLALLVLPIVIAAIVSSIFERPVKWMAARLKMSRTAAALVVALIVLCLMFGVVGVISVKAFSELRDFAGKLPGMYATFVAGFDEFLENLQLRHEFITPEFIESVNQFLAGLKGEISGAVSSVSMGIISGVTSIPQLIVALVVFFLATFFITRDRLVIGGAVDYQLPSKWIRGASRVKGELFSALIGYIRALFILMLITFVELIIGLSIIRVEYALLIAVVIALLDMLPVLGTGTIVVPWAVISLIVGDTRTGIGLLIMFAIIWVVRQVLEPNIVGNQIGMHPLITLSAMYIGMKLLGVFGMILGPILAILARNIIRVYLKGGTLREMIYEGAEQSEEDAAKRPRAPREPRPSRVERFFRRVWSWITKLWRK